MPAFSPYRLFRQNLKRHWVSYSLGLVALLVTSTSEIFLPKFIQWAIDIATHSTKADAIPEFLRQNDNHQTLNRLVLSLLGMLLLGWIGRVAWRQILARRSHNAGHEIKTKIWDILKDQPLSLTDRHSLGDLMNRATADWNKTRFIHGFTIVTTVDLIFFTGLSVISMLMIHAKTAILCLLIIPFLPSRIIRISREEYKLHEIAQEQLSLLSDLISQTVGTVRLQRATASEQIWLDRLRAYAEEYAKRQFAVLKTSWRIFIYGALPTIFAYAILFTYGITQIQAGEITIGAFVALQSYVVLLQTPLFDMGSNIAEWQTGFASYKRITDLYRLGHTHPTPQPTSPEQRAKAKEAQAVLSLEHLAVRFDEHRTVLKDLNLQVMAGERIGFMGPIGSGKTTLVHAIAGLLDDYSGRVLIQGVDIRSCGRDWITEHISMVPQKPFLFAGSVRHNLAPSQTLPDEALIEILQCVELWDDVQRFEDGMNSWIGEWGINLSGGQKQRLSLARALLKPAPILILDDCLSAVDSLTEARILDNLKTHLEGKAVLWTAHRLSTLHLCQRIYRMEDGQMSAFESEESGRSQDMQRQDLNNPVFEV